MNQSTPFFRTSYRKLLPLELRPNFWRIVLQQYFSSGWAFLMPYLIVYMIYFWRKWPVNTLSSALHRQGEHFPNLLHVYWGIHVLHLFLLIVALYQRYLQPNSREVGLAIEKSERRLVSSQFSAGLRNLTSSMIPWLLLALVFFLPGAYLEWPSDPWDHFRRITEWKFLDTAGHHSAGYKSLYFLSYSFLGRIAPIHQIFWLSVYYTFASLLLARQYYLLAKAVGLDTRWAFLSVVVNVLTFGNVCFSFYRYYALASTIFAQIGAVAFIRIVLDLLKTSNFVYFDYSRNAIFSFSFRMHANLFGKAIALILVFCLIALNHIQGLGVAGLGVASIAIWKIIRWKGTFAYWVLAVAIGLAIATVYLYPRSTLIDSYYRPAGWLNAWYGFNLFSWPSPAADRAIQILGLFGILNLACGIFLLGRNEIVAWLTIAPILALAFPPFSLILADRLALAESGGGDIITFHRMLFAIPSGLALVFSLRLLTNSVLSRFSLLEIRNHKLALSACIFVFCLPLLLAMEVPARGSSFNRVWHQLMRVPEDLQLTPIWDDLADSHSVEPKDFFVSTADLCVIESMQIPINPVVFGRVNNIAYSDLDTIVSAVSADSNRSEMVIAIPLVSWIYTPYSFAALCSEHWTAQAVPAIITGSKELLLIDVSESPKDTLNPIGAIRYLKGKGTAKRVQ